MSYRLRLQISEYVSEFECDRLWQIVFGDRSKPLAQLESADVLVRTCSRMRETEVQFENPVLTFIGGRTRY